MDVSPIARLFLSAFVCVFFLSSCGNRFDLSTERGRRARIDEANFHLSKGQCAEALEAINHVYASGQVDDEVRLVKSSAHACVGTFNMLTFVSNIAGASNFLTVIAKSLSNSAGDGARAAFYQAVDTLTVNGTALAGIQRSASVNNYMVFLQMGVIGSIIRNYGNPDANGAQGTALIYDTAASPAGEMSNEDACALSAALSIISDSFTHSSLTDGDTVAFNNAINSICVSAGLSSCAALSKNRGACDGTNSESVAAQAVVGGVNAYW